ncbi:globin family protein [Gracilibacillus massiliensis]|uniref:hypothetical protein n=1 Tax=Gracilibacillus massiliensis TaxID=1564956 RepID=UPI00071DF56F|nr:hypothetical protein [Gracilibacillus massiliensis]
MSESINNQEAIIEEVVSAIYHAYPNLLEKYGEAGVIRCKEDNQHHLDHLATAYSLHDESVFLDYTNWLHELLSARGMSAKHISFNFEQLQQVLSQKQAPYTEFYLNCLSKAINQLTKK